MKPGSSPSNVVDLWAVPDATAHQVWSVLPTSGDTLFGSAPIVIKNVGRTTGVNTLAADTIVCGAAGAVLVSTVNAAAGWQLEATADPGVYYIGSVVSSVCMAVCVCVWWCVQGGWLRGRRSSGAWGPSTAHHTVPPTPPADRPAAPRRVRHSLPGCQRRQLHQPAGGALQQGGRRRPDQVAAPAVLSRVLACGAGARKYAMNE